MCCKRNWMDMSDCLYYWEGNSNQIESKFQQRINLKGITHEQFPRRHAHQTHLRQVRASVLGPGQRNQRRISARLSRVWGFERYSEGQGVSGLRRKTSARLFQLPREAEQATPLNRRLPLGTAKSHRIPESRSGRLPSSCRFLALLGGAVSMQFDESLTVGIFEVLEFTSQDSTDPCL